ncbi:MAG: hypothetical protein SVZ03_12770 [Spirochaetota bacterium]|nr:hypothetical protein [Spirochaetota bacterium]
MSKPAENVSPAPVMTTTFTSIHAASSVKAVEISSLRAIDSAFFLFGLLKVIVATLFYNIFHFYAP